MSSGKRNQRHEEPSRQHLILVSDTSEFDTHVVHRFQAEGFNVIYLPFLGCGDDEKDRKALEHAVHEQEDELETGERYAIVGTCSVSSFAPLYTSRPNLRQISVKSTFISIH